LRLGSGSRQAVYPRGSAAVECGLFRRRRARGYALERVPQFGISARLLVGRKVALEHAAVGTKGFHAGLDILAPRRSEVFGGRRPVALVEIEAERGHADTTELDINIGAFR